MTLHVWNRTHAFTLILPPLIQYLWILSGLPFCGQRENPFSDKEKTGSHYSQYIYCFFPSVNVCIQCDRLHPLWPLPCVIRHLPAMATLLPWPLGLSAPWPLAAPSPQTLTHSPWEGKLRQDGLRGTKG